MSGWTRLARFVSSTVYDGSPGGVGEWSASTGSRITQSLFTWSQPSAQSKAITRHSEAA